MGSSALVVLRGAVPESFSGDGYGSGYGDGSGDGSGYGDGSGSGSGYGYGDGYGSGYGDGSGSGSGYGYGYGSLQSHVTSYLERLGKRIADAVVAFWMSDESGRPANGGKSDPVYPGLVQKIKGPLRICTKNALHATFHPAKWNGTRCWLVALRGKVEQQDDKLGALEREIIAEIPVPFMPIPEDVEKSA